MKIANRITTTELHRLQIGEKPITVFDVRTPVEFREAHARCAKNLPLDRISAKAVRAVASGSPIFLTCRTGRRAEEARQKLARQGLDNVIAVDGGAEEWENAGFEVIRGRKAVSIERQVRIAAGSLILAGTILGIIAHSVFLMVPAFVGAGLAFAGMTDTCAMGMILARMPWNQVNEDGETSCSV